MKTVLEVPVTTDYDINNFLIGNDEQIIIEFENIIKVFDQKVGNIFVFMQIGKLNINFIMIVNIIFFVILIIFIFMFMMRSGNYTVKLKCLLVTIFI